jgi:hypothetical protein
MTETFWVGDLGYVMGDVWDEVCDLLFPAHSEMGVYGKHKLKDGREFVIFSTYYGDGLYYDQFGRSYPVDAGVIGAIRLLDIRDLPIRPDLGNLHNLSASDVFENSYSEDGTIVIGGVVRVDTKGGSDDDEEDDDDEDF